MLEGQMPRMTGHAPNLAARFLSGLGMLPFSVPSWLNGHHSRGQPWSVAGVPSLNVPICRSPAVAPSLLRACLCPPATSLQKGSRYAQSGILEVLAPA